MIDYSGTQVSITDEILLTAPDTAFNTSIVGAFLLPSSTALLISKYTPTPFPTQASFLLSSSSHFSESVVSTFLQLATLANSAWTCPMELTAPIRSCSKP